MAGKANPAQLLCLASVQGELYEQEAPLRETKEKDLARWAQFAQLFHVPLLSEKKCLKIRNLRINSSFTIVENKSLLTKTETV